LPLEEKNLNKTEGKVKDKVVGVSCCLSEEEARLLI